MAYLPRSPACVLFRETGGEVWLLAGLFCCLGSCRYDIDVLTRAFLFEDDRTVGRGKQGVVGAHADIRAGMPTRAALTDDNVARENSLVANFFTPRRWA